jgi:hypothetical protein
MSSFLNRIIASRKKSPSKAQTSTMKNIFKRSLANFRQSRARIEDVAIELSNQRSATPISATQISATPRSATPRSATQISATPRSATQISATPRSATQISATPRSSASRSTTPSVRRHVQQEAFDELNTTYGESRALDILNLKKSNTQNEINKINRQIFLLEQMLKQRRTLEEKDKYRRQIKILKALKLELKQNLAEITIELQSAIETMQKKHPKKGGTRKRRKYAKKY